MKVHVFVLASLVLFVGCASKSHSPSAHADSNGPRTPSSADGGAVVDRCLRQVGIEDRPLPDYLNRIDYTMSPGEQGEGARFSALTIEREFCEVAKAMVERRKSPKPGVANVTFIPIQHGERVAGFLHCIAEKLGADLRCDADRLGKNCFIYGLLETNSCP